MGEAKRRGPFEDRKQQAERRNETARQGEQDQSIVAVDGKRVLVSGGNRIGSTSGAALRLAIAAAMAMSAGSPLSPHNDSERR